MGLNYIWLGLLLIGFLSGIAHAIFGDISVLEDIVNSSFTASKTAFEIALFLTGVLSLWLGLTKVAEESRLVDVIARWISPVLSCFFPEIPPNHPVMSSLMLNFSANMLGLDNAATPLGLKAMKQMQELNPQKDTASNSQIMFLVLNTSGLTIVPISIMAYRAKFGASAPAEVFLPILLSTFSATLFGLIITSLYQKINILSKAFLSIIIIGVGFIFAMVFMFKSLDNEQIKFISALISNLSLVLIMSSILAYALFKKINVYEAFIRGAKEGFEVAIMVVPYLVAMLVAIAIFRSSKSMDLILDALSYVLEACGVYGEYIYALPVAFMKPLSGSGARAMMVDTIQQYGVDSFVGKLSSIMQGTTDTTLYILALYFGSVNIKKVRHAMTCGLFADLIGIIASIFIAYLFFL